MILWKPLNQANDSAHAQDHSRCEQCDTLTLEICVRVASMYGVGHNVSDDPKQRYVVENLHRGYNQAIRKLAEDLYSKQVRYVLISTCIHVYAYTYIQVRELLQYYTYASSWYEHTYIYVYTYTHIYAYLYAYIYMHTYMWKCCSLCSKSFKLPRQ
jgi:hypothetical protein